MCLGVHPSRRLPHQVYRAVRNKVQDAAVKLLTNVDAAQMATFSQVSITPWLCSALPFSAVPSHATLYMSRKTGVSFMFACHAVLPAGQVPGQEI